MSGEEPVKATFDNLMTNYDNLFPILLERIKNPEKSFLLRKPAPTSDAAKFKQCIVDFKDPLVKALEIRLGREFSQRYRAEKAGKDAKNLDLRQVRKELGENESARALLSHLRGSVEETTTISRDLRQATESTFMTPRLQYVFYMNEALERLKNPASPCRLFERMKNLVDATTSKDIGVSIDDLIKSANKVLSVGDDAPREAAEIKLGPKIAAEAYRQALPLPPGIKGGRKTVKKGGRRHKKGGRKTSKMRCY